MIHLQGISKQFGSKVLFEEAELHIGYHSKVALIGPNGSGKSTLMRILLNQESPDSGKLICSPHLRIGYLSQETQEASHGSIFQEMMKIDARRQEVLHAKNELEVFLEKNPSSEEALEHYSRIIEEYAVLDEGKLEARAKEILMGMGFSSQQFHKSLSEFSGGWRMRLALARVLLIEPDFLVLDEPTNHLDLESLLWLENFLKDFRGSFLLVSHDAQFLNQLVHEVFEIDQKKIWIYRGNLDAYALQKQERLSLLQSKYQGQQAKIAEMESFISRFGAKATKARQAQSRLKQLEKMEKIELPQDQAKLHFRFPSARSSGKEVVTAQSACLSYGERVVFRDLNWVIRKGSRISIVGVNGAGKTTLLKLLSGGIQPDAGVIRLGHAVEVGYYAQHQAETLDFQKSILQELEKVAPQLPVAQVRGVAGAFLFTGDAAHKKCGVLSGGEKARVALAKLLLSPSNFLLLDEPTNHLDAQSKEVLLEALRNYAGTLCLVSHDRGFVSGLVDSVLEILPHENLGAQVVQLLGSYEDYLEKKQASLQKIVSEKAPSQKRKKAHSKNLESGFSQHQSQNQKSLWKKEKQAVEKKIDLLEKRQQELHALIGDPLSYQNESQLRFWMNEQRALEKDLGELMMRWEKLCYSLEVREV